MKVELIDTIDVNRKALLSMMEAAEWFFSQYLTTKIIPTSELSFDICEVRTNIELGSYGIRHHDILGSWVYGTGLAEPRLSYVLKKINKLYGYV